MTLKEAEKIHNNFMRTYRKAIITLFTNKPDLKVADIFILFHIKYTVEGKSISEIVDYKLKNELPKDEYTKMDKNNFKVKVSKIIKKYVSLNLIQVVPSSDDKRKHKVYLTKLGNDIIKKVEKQANEYWKEEYEK